MGKVSEWTFLQRGHTDGQETYAKMLNVTYHQKMQIKTTMRYLLTYIRMASINKLTNNKCWWGCGERGTLLHCWWECILVQLQYGDRYLKKLKMGLPLDLAIPLLGIYLKESRTLIWKNISIPMFIAVFFTITKI